jgi:hypothetical protein
MGNLVSTANPSDNEQMEDLKRRLVSLEELDRNKDGQVSKDEVDSWMNQQKEDLDAFKKKIVEQTEAQVEAKYRQDLANSDLKIKELEKELQSLKNINNTMSKQLQAKNLVESNAELPELKEEYARQLKELSKARIRQYVDNMLKDEDINISWMPDYVEKQIYRNVFTMLISLMENLFETSGVKLIGHRLTFHLEPNEQTPAQSDEDHSQSHDYDEDDEDEHEHEHKRHKKKKKHHGFFGH